VPAPSPSTPGSVPVALDYRPFDHLSPFLFVNYEASYENACSTASAVGLGGKAVLLSTGATEANISLAMLAERMRPRRFRRTRPSSRRALVGQARFAPVRSAAQAVAHNLWQPRVTDLEDYTVNSTSELSLAVRQSTSFTVSYLALYDSAARSRFRTNDAQLLFGVKTGF
jgi:hypothetical protein